MNKVTDQERYPCDLESTLLKNMGAIKGWKRFWTIIKANKIYYFKYKGDTYCKGMVFLDQKTLVMKVKELEFNIVTITNGKSHTDHFHCDTAADVAQWISVVQRNISRLQPGAVIAPAAIAAPYPTMAPQYHPPLSPPHPQQYGSSPVQNQYYAPPPPMNQGYPTPLSPPHPQQYQQYQYQQQPYYQQQQGQYNQPPPQQPGQYNQPPPQQSGQYNQPPQPYPYQPNTQPQPQSQQQMEELPYEPTPSAPLANSNSSNAISKPGTYNKPLPTPAMSTPNLSKNISNNNNSNGANNNNQPASLTKVLPPLPNGPASKSMSQMPPNQPAQFYPKPQPPQQPGQYNQPQPQLYPQIDQNQAPQPYVPKPGQYNQPVPPTPLAPGQYNQPPVLMGPPTPFSGPGYGMAAPMMMPPPIVDGKLVPPPGCVLMAPPQGELIVRIISAKNLVAADSNGKSDPYVILRTPTSPVDPIKTRVIYKNLNPVWNEVLTIPIHNVQHDLLVLEVYDHDKISTDDIIGFVGIDLSLLPMGAEVVTTEQLSYVEHGNIQIGLTAVNFGIQNYPPNYPYDYIQWRQSIPTVSKKGMKKEKKEAKHHQKHKVKNANAPKKPSGPYDHSIVHSRYEIINGWVKKKPTTSEKVGKVAKTTGIIIGATILGALSG